MPQYDYRCNECKIEFSVERSMSDATDTNCLACKSANVGRIWNVQFAASKKGAGNSAKQQQPKPMGGSCCGGGRCGPGH
jgi:putative FmdB family regulatory protein